MKKNTFKLEGKTYHHDIFTRAMIVGTRVLVSNAHPSFSDEDVKRVALGGIDIPTKFEGHLNYDSKTGKWYDNKGEVKATGIVMGGTPTHKFSFKTFSNWEDFETECK